MRINYWSLSKFAGLLRKLFGLPEMIPFGTSEQWNEFNKLEQSISPFGIKVIDSLDTIQNIVYAPIDLYTNITYFCANVKNKSHILRTRTKFGRYSDITAKIPDALMFAIIDFVRSDCFNACVRSVDEILEPEIVEYQNQSYFMRKLFPVKISDRLKEIRGIEYIQFQIDQCDIDSEPVKAYKEILEAYKFASERYFTFDPYIETDYYSLVKTDDSCFGVISEEQRDCFKKIHELEEIFEKEVEIHCCNIVKYRKYLWT